MGAAHHTSGNIISYCFRLGLRMGREKRKRAKNKQRNIKNNLQNNNSNTLKQTKWNGQKIMITTCTHSLTCEHERVHSFIHSCSLAWEYCGPFGCCCRWLCFFPKVFGYVCSFQSIFTCWLNWFCAFILFMLFSPHFASLVFSFCHCFHRVHLTHADTHDTKLTLSFVQSLTEKSFESFGLSRCKAGLQSTNVSLMWCFYLLIYLNCHLFENVYLSRLLIPFYLSLRASSLCCFYSHSRTHTSASIFNRFISDPSSRWACVQHSNEKLFEANWFLRSVRMRCVPVPVYKSN